MDDTAIAALSASAAIIAAVGGVFGAGATAWVQRRRETGTVRTSDAQTLFTASNQLIQMLLQATQSLADRLDHMTKQFDELMARVERIVKQQDELLRLQLDQTRTLHRIESNGNGGGKDEAPKRGQGAAGGDA
jgi:uncharacterized protein HemX